MTFTEFCQDRGISRATLYRQLHTHAINPDTLRDNGGHITPEGLKTLSALTDSTQIHPAHRAKKTPVKSFSAPTEETMQLKHEIELLTLKLTNANENVSRLIADNAALKADNERLTGQLSAARNDAIKAHDALVKELSRTWFDRLTGRNKAVLTLPATPTEE